MARTIQSPGVEINEIDLSLRPNLPTGTTVLAAGFSDKGPTDEVIQVTSLSEFEQIYGVPTTPAERYFYHSVRPLFNSPANILAYRLPYGASTGQGFGNSYGALAYPARVQVLSGTGIDGTTFSQAVSTNDQNVSVDAGMNIILGQPVHFELSQQQFIDISTGNGFEWSDTPTDTIASFEDLGKAAVIVLNKGQTTVNGKFEGYYLGISDNTNLNDATNFDAVISAETLAASATVSSEYLRLPTTRLNFSLSALNDAATNQFGQDDDSISEVLENLTEFPIDGNDFDDTLSIGLFKLRQSVFAADVIKLDYVLSESYVGSLDFHRQIQSQTGGAARSFFLGFEEDQSPNIEVLINENLSHRNGSTWRGLDGNPINKVRLTAEKYNTAGGIDTNFRPVSSSWIPSDYIDNTGTTNPHSLLAYVSGAADAATSGLLPSSLAKDNSVAGIGCADKLFTVGTFADANLQSEQKNLGSIPSKVQRLLDTVENPDIFDIDITIEAGLGTINAGRKENGGDEYYDELTFVNSMSGFYTSNVQDIDELAVSYRSNWQAIYNLFNSFAEKKRKDHLFIADLPRPIFVQGANFKTLADQNKNFSLNIQKPIEAFTTLLNSSYSTTYACWTKVYDKVLDEQTWVPFSGTAAEIMANTDANFQPWFAPAGFTRGRVGSVNDIALYPKQKQRDQLYSRATVNPVAFFPGDGFVVFGQKTLQAAPTAFDRINVRRLFLNLEKATRNTVKYFIFEPNTLLTRTRIINTLTPIFENAKNTEGLYDYLIVCDERNNTPDVIDQNELVVDIYLKPVRAAEFILVNFYATRTGTDFNEIVG